MAAGVRAGACIHAQRPRPGGTAAVARARRCGSRADSGGGCHTGDMKTAASAPARKEPARKRAGALAAVMPLRQRSGGDRTGRRRLPHGRWVLSSRNARAASRGRPVWLRSSAASASPWPCAWQPLGLPHWVFETGGGPAASTPQQACAVRMACGRPSAVMPPRNARRRPYRRAATVMPGGNAGGPVVRPTAWT
jgi:hypothetical protein